MGRPRKIENIYNAPKSNTQFSEGQKSKGILDDYGERQVIDTKEGTIQDTPTSDKHIANKKYVDDNIGGGAHASSHEIGGADLVDHDQLTNFVGDEHLDWTADQGAKNIHANNYTDSDTTAHASFSQLDYASAGHTGFQPALTSYETGWINRSDWTNVHMGSSTTKNADSNVAHNLNTDTVNLIVQVKVSSNGLDSGSVDVFNFTDDGGIRGITASQVDSNNIKLQTGGGGLGFIQDNGTLYSVNTENWYYKIKVWKLG